MHPTSGSIPVDHQPALFALFRTLMRTIIVALARIHTRTTCIITIASLPSALFTMDPIKYTVNLNSLPSTKSGLQRIKDKSNLTICRNTKND